METFLAVLIAVDVLGAFAALLLCALCGFTFRESLRRFLEIVSDPVETYRKSKRGEW